MSEWKKEMLTIGSNEQSERALIMQQGTSQHKFFR
jgi:hypothetical protein